MGNKCVETNQKRSRGRDIKICVRVNDQEAKWLEEAAWRQRQSRAAFIREKVFQGEMPRIPVEVRELLRQLTYEVNKVGINVNQLIRSYHINGYQTAYEKKMLTDDMDQILELHARIYDRIREAVESGGNKTAPAQGGKGG